MSENQPSAMKGKDKRAMRSKGQTLKPTIVIGKAGVNDNILAKVDSAFIQTDLIKVRLSEGTGKARKLAAQQIADDLNAQVVGITGKSILLYRAKHETSEE